MSGVHRGPTPYRNIKALKKTRLRGPCKKAISKEENSIPWTTDILKPELYELCKRLSPIPEYKLNQIAEVAEHSILRTPQYRPELQPIETCWGVVKNYIAAHCDFTMKNFREHLSIAFTELTSRICKSLIAKVVTQEEKYWAEDSQLYEEIDENGGIFR